MEAKAQADMIHLKTVKSEDAARETHFESEVLSKGTIQCLQVDSELDDLSRLQGLLRDAGSVVRTVESKRHDLKTTMWHEKMMLKDELRTERKLYYHSRNALRRQQSHDRNKKFQLKTMITDLEGQKEKLECDVSLMRNEQDEYKSKLEEALAKQDSLRGEKNQLETDLQSMRETSQGLKLDLDKERKRTLCQLCMKLPKDTLWFPCLHLSSCFSCSEKIRKRKQPTCPTCRTTIKSVLKLPAHE